MTGRDEPTRSPSAVSEEPSRPRTSRPRSGRVLPDAVVPAVTGALGLLHALLLAPLYHVGSFDDDASYVLIAKALARGTGLGGMLPAGYPVIGTYPPGFPLLLAPVALVAGSATWPYRVLVLCFFLALFPLTDLWLRRSSAPPWLRWSVLLLLALNPVAATYATMVMAEAPFLVLSVLVVLLARRWAAAGRLFSPAAGGTVLLGAALIWVKEAGVGLIAGLALWFLLRRAWRQAVALLVGVGVACAPILLYRAAVGTPLAGSRYSSEIGGNMRLSAVPHAIVDYWTTALPRSIVPLVGLPSGVFAVVTVTVPVFVVIGAVVWLRRHRADPAGVMTVVYLAETLLYPYVNERRVILVLPVVLAWYAVGAQLCLRLVGRAVARLRPGLRVEVPLAALLALFLAVPLGAQLHRNYRLDSGQQTSRPLGSPYMAFARAVTRPGDVVESDYVWTTSLATGRRTANSAFPADGCAASDVRRGADEDGAGILVAAALSTPPPVPRCPSEVLVDASWAVPLYSTAQDDATVWELVGPGTRNPGLSDSVRGPGTVATSGDSTTTTWSWGSPRVLTQLSAGVAAPHTGRASAVRLEWQDPSGSWHRVASATGAVGPAEATPFLAWLPGTPVTATGVRLVVVGGSGADVGQVHALTRSGS